MQNDQMKRRHGLGLQGMHQARDLRITSIGDDIDRQRHMARQGRVVAMDKTPGRVTWQRLRRADDPRTIDRRRKGDRSGDDRIGGHRTGRCRRLAQTGNFSPQCIDQAHILGQLHGANETVMFEASDIGAGCHIVRDPARFRRRSVGFAEHHDEIVPKLSRPALSGERFHQVYLDARPFCPGLQGQPGIGEKSPVVERIAVVYSVRWCVDVQDPARRQHPRAFQKGDPEQGIVLETGRRNDHVEMPVRERIGIRIAQHDIDPVAWRQVDPGIGQMPRTDGTEGAIDVHGADIQHALKPRLRVDIEKPFAVIQGAGMHDGVSFQRGSPAEPRLLPCPFGAERSHALRCLWRPGPVCLFSGSAPS